MVVVCSGFIFSCLDIVLKEILFRMVIVFFESIVMCWVWWLNIVIGLGSLILCR